MPSVTSEVAGAAWRARYPDLGGKVAVVSGDHHATTEVVAALAATGCAIAVVARDRTRIDSAVAAAESSGVAVFGVVSDPADEATWHRVVPHSEQRLGPLDVLVALGTATTRAASIAAIAPDMAARRRGIVVEVGGADPRRQLPDGVRHRLVTATEAATPLDIAAAVALCASDVLTAPFAAVTLGSRD
jgi:NADP-dependent 3-hydroxy acid dehydrogenase YdfG